MNSIFRKTVSVVVSMVMLSTPLVTFASSNANSENSKNTSVTKVSQSSQMTAEQLKEKLKSLGYDVQYVRKASGITSAASGKAQVFDTVEDFVKFDRQLHIEKNVVSSGSNLNTSPIPWKSNLVSAASTKTGFARAKVYAPYANGTLFCWKNVDFWYAASYYPLAGYYTLKSVSNPQSYISGLYTGVKWTQTGISSTIDSTGLYATFNVSGYYNYEIYIAGIAVGTTSHDTWKVKSSNINKYIK